jgi:hypothetical protein
MRLQKKSLLVWFLLTMLLCACNSEQEEVLQKDDPDNSGELWADSILGGLSEQQKYFQHLIIEIPAQYQNASDSLSKWIVANQPGAIILLRMAPRQHSKFEIRIRYASITYNPFSSQTILT